MKKILVTIVLLALTGMCFAQAQAPPAAAPAAAPDDTTARLKALEEKILALERLALRGKA